MDFSDDEDIFISSNDLATNLASSSKVSLTEKDNDSNSRNPIKEHLLKQLNEVHERVERKKQEIEETKSLKEKIMRKFKSRHLFGDSSSSDSESELFTAGGEPIVKRRRRSFKRIRKEPLLIKGHWQHVTDDKWIVGVVLQNTIEEDLYELDLYMKIKDLDNLTGLSSFWTRDSRSFWRRTDLAGASGSSSSEVAATIVLDLPKFTINKVTKIFGIVSYELEDQRKLQTLIPTIELNIENILKGDYLLKFIFNENHSSNYPSALDSTVQAILSAKSLSIEKITEFKFSNQLKNDDIIKIFYNIGLREILPKVFTFDYLTADRLSIVEITSANSSTNMKFKTVIYARSVQRLNIILHMLHSVFPNGTSLACRNVTTDDVIKAFKTELNLYLTTENNFEIQKAVVNSDFISKEFENGFTIYRA